VLATDHEEAFLQRYEPHARLGFVVFGNPALVPTVGEIHEQNELDDDEQASAKQSCPSIGNKEGIGDKERSNGNGAEEKELEKPPAILQSGTAVAGRANTQKDTCHEEMEHL
jgi:hypothetical protein